MDKIHSTMQKHFWADDVFNAIVRAGGPDLQDYMIARWDCMDASCYVEYPDWTYINEFLTREEGLWWEYFGKVTDVNAGEGFYMDFWR